MTTPDPEYVSDRASMGLLDAVSEAVAASRAMTSDQRGDLLRDVGSISAHADGDVNVHPLVARWWHAMLTVLVLAEGAQHGDLGGLHLRAPDGDTGGGAGERGGQDG